MTRVFLDSRAGFCAGVKRTIRGAREAAAHGRQVVSYGEIIHNPGVTRDLAQCGVSARQRLEEIGQTDFVVIRAHGIPPQEEEWLQKRNIPYLDLTCRRVKDIHKSIEEKRKQGFEIIIIGDPDHPEVKGHLGYASREAGGDGNGRVLSDLKRAKDFIRAYPRNRKLLALAQTTTSPELFYSVIRLLKDEGLDLEILNTLCPYVLKRQEWIRKYSRQADASLIIGGKNSSNTKKLFEIASRNGACFWIQSAAGLDREKMLSFSTLALTAGASTPDKSIREVIQLLESGGAVIELC